MMFVFLITGCTNKKEISNNTHVTDDDIIDTELKKFNMVKIDCDEIKNISDISHYQNLFITKDGNLYQISYDKIFSNGTNCKRIESENRFTRFIIGGILDSNNDIYNYTNNNELVLYDPSIGNIFMPNIMIEKISNDMYQNIIYSNEDQKYGENQIYYFYYDSNKKEIYSYSNDLTKMSNEPIFSLTNDEEMEYLTYGGIKTNKNFYIYGRRATNKEECEKYADIKCEMKNGFYSITDENIINQIDYIKFISISGNIYFILDDNLNFYTNVMGG